ncbi:MAG TPA: hypothetical protein DC042_13495 [Bacteroidales bacterium]|nr:hypothetical protein [Bacteroidales bacterium]
MIIRATQYLYRLSGVPSVKNTEEPPSPFPGEWYANFVERFDGRYNAIHFLHNPTRVSVLVPGPFLDQSIAGLRERAAALLMRKGYGRLLFQYGLLSPPEFYSTNSRSILASMNQMRYEIEYHLSMPEINKENNLDRIEDIEFETIIRTGKKLMDFTTPVRILDELMSKFS